eukprot:1177095-Prorocentrum_minimum.AAC.3
MYLPSFMGSATGAISLPFAVSRSTRKEPADPDGRVKAIQIADKCEFVPCPIVIVSCARKVTSATSNARILFDR